MAETKFVTGKVRLSYPALFEPKSINGSEPKYSASLIIDKDDKVTLDKYKAALAQATEDGTPKFKNGKVPANLKKPLRDGDTDREEDPAYEGKFFLNANSNRKPQCVDQRKNKIEDPEDLYPGCYVRASVTLFAFNSNGNQGIAVGLNNIQKWSEGEPLAGGSTAADDFDELEVGEDDILGDDEDLI